jgi:hypothetical protein
MKFKEVSDKKYKIFLDCDGVICDLEAQFIKIYGTDTQHYKDKYSDNAVFRAFVKAGKSFWSTMPWMKDGKELWNFIKNEDVTVLTAPIQDDNCYTGKREWCLRELGLSGDRVIIDKRKEKYASENSILIDDSYEKRIIPFREKGGIGIHHKNAKTTIQQLRRLGIGK